MGLSKLMSFASATEEDPLCPDQEAPVPAIPNSKSNDNFNRRNRTYAVLSAAGSAALVACALVAAVRGRTASNAHGALQAHRAKQVDYVGLSCDYREIPVCPAWDLFSNPEVHEVATENILRVGHQLLGPTDRQTVMAAVATGFKNISSQLQSRAPLVAGELTMLQLTEQEKDAVLSSLRLLSDSRVQVLGRNVAQAIRDCGSPDRDYVRSCIETAMQPRLTEITDLRREVVPKGLRQLWGVGNKWDMTLDPENILAMQTSHGGRFAAVSASLQDIYAMGTTNRPTTLSEKNYGIKGGVIEEGRALLDIIKLCTRLTGKELKVPSWAGSLTGNVDLRAEPLSCELDTTKASSVNFMKALFCALKFGTQGLDALRAASAISPTGATK